MFSFEYMSIAWPIWRRFEPHFTRLAVSRARLSDGSRIDTMHPHTSTPPIPNTTPRTMSTIFVALLFGGGGE